MDLMLCANSQKIYCYSNVELLFNVLVYHERNIHVS